LLLLEKVPALRKLLTLAKSKKFPLNIFPLPRLFRLPFTWEPILKEFEKEARQISYQRPQILLLSGLEWRAFRKCTRCRLLEQTMPRTSKIFVEFNNRFQQGI
jgi:hypothetical protein